MSDRYQDFGTFMTDVVQEANRRVDLNALFAATGGGHKSPTIREVVSFAVASPNLFLFSIAGPKSGSDNEAARKARYRDEHLPNKIMEVTREFRPLYSDTLAKNLQEFRRQREIDALLGIAADSLIGKAITSSLAAQKGK